MRNLLEKLYEHYPDDYKSKIICSLNNLNRNDVLKDIENIDKLKISMALKNFYIQRFKEIDEPQPPLKTTFNVNLLNKFIDLCIVDAINVKKDTAYTIERTEFLKKQMNYKLIPYEEVFRDEKSLLLISGIAGIGKSWLLKKCLLDWANNRIWEKVNLVFYFECKFLNLYENISNINELLNVFYKDFAKDLDINKHNILFVFDGLDEFKYLNELVNPSPSCEYPILNALAEIRKYNHVVAGRVYATDQFQNLDPENCNKLTIQIMGFNKDGINNYIENNVNQNKKEDVKNFLKGSKTAKAMASVPFYLSLMCKIIIDFKQTNTSFLTMTDLYASIFFYFYQKHINRTNEPIYKTMESKYHKKYVFTICKIAYKLFVKNKVVFSREEFRKFTSDLGKVDNQFFGFIERIETNLGYHYQFLHLTLMEFCAAVYAYNKFSGEEIISKKKLNSCLSMICGLTNLSQNSLIRFLVDLNQGQYWFCNCLFNFYDYNENMTSINEEKMSMIHICNLIRNHLSSQFDYLFIECFYESQSLITEELKPTVNKRKWVISIDDGKSSYETSCQKYFVNHYLNSGGKLTKLKVCKKNLTDEEKDLLVQCSNNVRILIFCCPIKIEGLKRENKVEWLRICISNYIISRRDFKECFLPWMKVCEKLEVRLHNDIKFVKNIFKWIHKLNIQWLMITYRESRFNLEDVKNFNSTKKCPIS
ncbi:NACHT, LRR and PYD domains-containing protein 3 isoform X2 [Hydra vulgaris]|nr:NACHT, LRR and PYD domains-containing protein 3 isoform X2 [Hydra vulgaris]